MPNSLHMYIRRPNTLPAEGVFSPSMAFHKYLAHYIARTKSRRKAAILKYLEESFPGRSRSVSVLTGPIPDDAGNPDLLEFRDTHDHVVLPSLEELRRRRLVEAVHEALSKAGWREVEAIDCTLPDFSKSKPWGLLFKGVRHYNLTLPKGSIPPAHIAINPKEDPR